MINKHITGLIAGLFVLGIASYGACGPVNYNETTDGNIKGLTRSPFNFEIGTNIIKGSLSYPHGSSDDFNFNIGSGMVLNSICYDFEATYYDLDNQFTKWAADHPVITTHMFPFVTIADHKNIYVLNDSSPTFLFTETLPIGEGDYRFHRWQTVIKGDKFDLDYTLTFDVGSAAVP
jgi:hypothetical protein